MIAWLPLLLLGAVADDSARAPLSVDGRLLLRSTFEEDGGAWNGRVETARARLGATFERDGTRARLTAELTDDRPVRDAWIEWGRGKGGLSLRAGRFKTPFTRLGLRSSWDLPAIDRGPIQDLLSRRFEIGGRQHGMRLAWRGSSTGRPSIEAAVWQSPAADGDRRAAGESEGFGGSAAVRIEARIAGLSFGATGLSRRAEPIPGSRFRPYPAAAVDVSREPEFGPRLWADAAVGRSWLDEDPLDRRDPTFATARLLAGWRLPIGGTRHLEPYLRAGALDPDIERTDDVVREATVGAGVGLGRRWRTQVEHRWTGFGRHGPDGGEGLPERAWRLQLGADF